MRRGLVVGLALGFAMPVLAHKPVPDRRVMVQVDEAGTVAVFELTVRGPEAALLRAVHDANHDGELAGVERERLAAVLVTKAVRGVGFAQGTLDLGMTPREVRLLEDGADKAQLKAMGLVELGGASMRAGAPFTLNISVEGGSGPAAVQLQGLGPFAVVAASRGALAPDHRGLADFVNMNPGEALAVQLVRLAPSGDSHADPRR